MYVGFCCIIHNSRGRVEPITLLISSWWWTSFFPADWWACNRIYTKIIADVYITYMYAVCSVIYTIIYIALYIVYNLFQIIFNTYNSIHYTVLNINIKGHNTDRIGVCSELSWKYFIMSSGIRIKYFSESREQTTILSLMSLFILI